jgi:hypothetical protein
LFIKIKLKVWNMKNVSMWYQEKIHSSTKYLLPHSEH